VFAEISGVSFWYHGLAYAIGFILIFLWLMVRRTYIGISPSRALDLSLIIAILGLLGGRTFEVFIYERSIFSGKYLEMASFWHGGMAITGVVAGLMAGALVFSLLYRKKFLAVADEVVIPFCLLLVLVRIANHLSGETYGSITGAWWGVKYPLADGFRHPVALYEALKDLIIFFILLFFAGRAETGRGKTTGQFFLWSGLGSFIVDYFGISSGHIALHPGTRQFFYVLVIVLGLLIIVHTVKKATKKYSDLGTMQFAPISFRNRRPATLGMIFLKILLFSVILVFCLTIPSGVSQQSIKDPASLSLHRTL
jgi:phosphatidylglycerol---prolipoprotein diacylglyceryl transferase